MSRKLDFTALSAEQIDEKRGAPLDVKATSKRWRSREPSEVVQMSLRMQSDVYDMFRALCTRERRTNGEMLEVLMKDYLK